MSLQQKLKRAITSIAITIHKTTFFVSMFFLLFHLINREQLVLDMLKGKIKNKSPV